jgi:hypothetical protein
MRRTRSILLTLALALGLAAGLPGGALADGDRGGDNSAVAINTEDGSSLFRLAVDIDWVSGDTVDNRNEAAAYSRCEDCRTTAIAFQIVLVSSKPSTVTPTNVAAAVNEGCTRCQTFASAHQFVKGTDGPMTFSWQGWRELYAVYRELRALKHEQLTPAELDARIDPLVERVRAVLNTELVPLRRGERDDDDDRDDRYGERRTIPQDERPTRSSRVEDED